VTAEGNRLGMKAKIIPFGLSRPAAEELIRRLSQADRFTVEPHAREWMLIRDFSDRQMSTAMQEGYVTQGPTLDECHDWRCRVKKRVAGRLVHVVVAIHDMDWLYVISVH
jgi:hypothetical protein